MAPHSSTLAWKIPWMEEPGRLQSMGSLRVRHAEGDEPGDGAQLQLALHHHHVVLAPLLGFPLALGDLARGPKGVLLPGGDPQEAAGGDHSERWRVGLSMGILQARILEWVAISFSNA